MSLGTLYGNFRIRTWVPQAIIKKFGLDIKIIAPEDNEQQFAKDFPLKKVPGFLGPEGFKLTETMAVMYYLTKLIPDEEAKRELLGANAEEQAQVIRWLSFANSELLIELVNVFKPLLGMSPFIKPLFDAAVAKVDQITAVFEERLIEHTYLASEDITLADLFATTVFARGFQHCLGSEWRAAHPAITRWYNTVKASDYLEEFFVDFKPCDKPLQPPQNNKKKEAKKETKKEAKKPSAEKPKAAAEDEKPAEQPKKPKHPLELLGKASFPLEDWKRKYSNEDTRPVALPWFWEHYNPEEYSIWRVDFKYNDELTLCFMSNNQVGGFMERLSASVKYMFGCIVVYGEDRNNGIVGAVMLRGQDYVPAFDVAPDWTSYDYAKLDPSKEEDKEFINIMWAWDKPVVINGEPREISDGKVLK
ncbi:Elongation factor 1-gamma 1 [Lachancea thermotolerans]